ncbi:ABC transporter permease [Tumebacillus sp. ITR2]|uniref:Transport permease protein n=2 Tax=Tumebacillus amylolyticus TaxID=2801339 RepID=A0ABS1J9L2_9BACL|nr:ABC transporter permease [Tumebacillus amylolyticus]MBL0386961.1 ABC transporter permease [Tumebacillus amylolyticus]
MMLTHAGFEIKMFFREIISVFFTFLLPAISFIFFGMMDGSQMYDGHNYIDTYIPGMVGIIIFSTAFFSIGMQVVMDREKGIYKRLRATPLTPLTVFVSIVAKGFFVIYFGALEIMLIAKFLFKGTLSDTIFDFYIAVTISALAFFACGFLIASFAKRMQTAMAISMVLMYPMMFLSGSTIPLSTLPKAMQILSNFIPMTYSVELMRKAWTGELWTSASIRPIAVLLGILIVGAFIGAKRFKWDN